MTDRTIDTLLLEERRYPAPEEFAEQANATAELYDVPFEEFWEREGRERVTWFEPFTSLLEWELPYAKWYGGGTLNVAYNCLDRHVEAGLGDRVAYYFEGEPVGERAAITYAQLLEEVVKAANGLKALGVGKGTPVGIYMGMGPGLPVAMLACARLGAPHTVVFGGFSAESLADRLNDMRCEVLLTQDEGWRRGQTVPLKAHADEALESCPGVRKVVVGQRTRAAVPMVAAGWLFVKSAAAALGVVLGTGAIAIASGVVDWSPPREPEAADAVVAPAAPKPPRAAPPNALAPAVEVAPEPEPEPEQVKAAPAASFALASPSASGASSLSVEAALLERARRELRAAPAVALSVATEHAQRFPRGQLSAERTLIQIEALHRLGRDGEARGLARGLLNGSNSGLYAERVLRAGGHGYIMKDQGGDKLLIAIRQVLGGKTYVSERVSTRIIDAFAGRSRKSESVTKATPALGANVKVAPSRPAKATACATPGRDSRMSVAFRMTASVRGSDEPGGSWNTAMK